MDVEPGELFYYLRFPFGLSVSNAVAPITRTGSIAQRSSYSQCSGRFLVEAFAFGGSSGSPAFYIPVMTSDKDSFEISIPKLVGIIAANLNLPRTYVANGIDSLKSDSMVVTIDQHTGLSIMYSSNTIWETVDILTSTH